MIVTLSNIHDKYLCYAERLKFWPEHNITCRYLRISRVFVSFVYFIISWKLICTWFHWSEVIIVMCRLAAAIWTGYVNWSVQWQGWPVEFKKYAPGSSSCYLLIYTKQTNVAKNHGSYMRFAKIYDASGKLRYGWYLHVIFLFYLSLSLLITEP